MCRGCPGRPLHAALRPSRRSELPAICGRAAAEVQGTPGSCPSCLGADLEGEWQGAYAGLCSRPRSSGLMLCDGLLLARQSAARTSASKYARAKGPSLFGSPSGTTAAWEVSSVRHGPRRSETSPVQPAPVSRKPPPYHRPSAPSLATLKSSGQGSPQTSRAPESRGTPKASFPVSLILRRTVLTLP